MVAGNGLVLPQRQFIQFASYPLLRSEEWLGRGQLGAGWNALECNGRLLLNHIFSLQGTGCRQETGSCAVQRINSKEYASTKHWSYHKLLHKYTQEIPSFIKCLKSSSLPCIIPWMCSHFCPRAPGQKQDNFPTEMKHDYVHIMLQVYLGMSLNSRPTLKESTGPSWHQLGMDFHLYVLFWAETSQKVCKQSPFFSVCIWMLGSQGTAVVQILTLAEEMKWKLINIAILNNFPPVNIFPGFPRSISSFSSKQKKVFRQSLKIFYTASCFPDLLKPGQSYRFWKAQQVQIQSLILQRGISATAHCVESNHLGSPIWRV